VGVAWLAVLALAATAAAVGSRRVHQVLGQLVEPFRDELVRHVVSGAVHRSAGGGDRPDTAAVARLTHQVEIVRDTYAGLVTVLRAFLATMVGASVGLFSVAPVLLALVLPPVLLGLGIFLASLGWAVARQRDYVAADERLAEDAGEAFQGLRDVVACGAEDRVAGLVGAAIDAQARAERTLARMAGIRTASMAVGGWLPVLAVVLAAPWLVGRGLTAGAVLGGLAYVVQAIQPALHTLVQGLGAGGLRFAVTLDRLLEAGSPSGRSPARAAPAPRRAHRPHGHAIELDRVTFRYGTAGEPVLRAFDLVVPEGDHLAVVGPSGIGKSTLAALVSGLLPPDSGEVRIGGVAVGELDRSILSGCRVLIPQEAYVFAGTVADNLRYLRPDVTSAELTAAAAAVGAGRLVDRLGGLDADVDPSRLSAGERQLLALTRAYVSTAPIVLLDEASCHLDPAAEDRAERAFADRPGTLVVIAHRVSSALRARRVLVLDGDRPVLGDHLELTERSPLYRDLVGHWLDADADAAAVPAAAAAVPTETTAAVPADTAAAVVPVDAVVSGAAAVPAVAAAAPAAASRGGVPELTASLRSRRS
jgi:ATP-binding cassette subfamily C protein